MEMVMFEPWVKNALEGIEYKIPEVTLRDLFAMNALNAIIAQCDFSESQRQYAEQAYNFADAMIDARKIKRQGD